MELEKPFEFNFGLLHDYLINGIPLKVNRIKNKKTLLTKFSIVNPRSLSFSCDNDLEYMVDVVYFYKTTVDVRSNIRVHDGYVAIDKRKVYIGPFNNNMILKDKINKVFDNEII